MFINLLANHSIVNEIARLKKESPQLPVLASRPMDWGASSPRNINRRRCFGINGTGPNIPLMVLAVERSPFVD
jgi:hypothetical protein